VLRFFRRLAAALRRPRRPQTLMVLFGLLLVSVFLLWQSAGIPQYKQNLALNVGADIIGATVTIFFITPLITRAQEGRVREHSRLDYEWYTDQVFGATNNVKVLDTFSNLLDHPATVRFFQAARQALGRQARVQFLLLDPDSLAVSMRAQELGEAPIAAHPLEGTGTADVRREIMRNMRTLDEFQRRLREEQKRLFEVRLYSASAGITLYRWDDRALASFLSIGRLSGQGIQLEVTISSPLGMFLEQRFDELWLQSKPMERFMRLNVTLVEPDGTSHDFATPFVTVDGQRYLTDVGVVSHMARRRDGTLSAYCRPDPATRYEPVMVDDPDLRTLVAGEYAEKYNASASTFVLLRPGAVER
jgi:hypothetical protein